MGGSVLEYRTSLPLLAALLLAACSSSPPVRFYTLNDVAPRAPPPAGAELVTIDGVNIPGEIDRPQIVRQIGANQLSFSDLHRWAAPLDETIRRVLTDDIARRVPAPVPGRHHAVFLDIREFYGDEGCTVTLRALWTQKTGDAQRDSVAQPVTENIRVPAGGACPATLPATMSVALGQLSDRIIAATSR